MLTKDECAVLINFLDKVKIKGHQERQNMNIIVSKLIVLGQKSEETKMKKLDKNLEKESNNAVNS